VIILYNQSQFIATLCPEISLTMVAVKSDIVYTH
jgi:hypothetical protein